MTSTGVKRLLKGKIAGPKMVYDDYPLKGGGVVPFKKIQGEIIRWHTKGLDGASIGTRHMADLLLKKYSIEMRFYALHSRVRRVIRSYRKIGLVIPLREGDGFRSHTTFVSEPVPTVEDIKNSSQEAPVLPEGVSDYLEPVVINNQDRKILCLFDVHVQYHSTQALTAALRYGVQKGANTIFIGGDFMDCYALSRFERDPDKRFFADERKVALDILAVIRKVFPKAEIYFKKGNHEHRMERMFNEKMPEMHGISDFTFQSVMRLDSLDFKMIEGHRLFICGSLTFLHGHEILGAGINVARSKALKAGSNIIFGHHHRTQTYLGPNIHNELGGSWSVGCLCQVNPKWNPYANGWNQGFAFVTVNKDGSFIIENKSIYNGQIY